MGLDLYFVFGLSQCLIQSITIIANVMTIIAFAKVRSLRIHTSNILIYVLSITDLIWGLYVLIYYGVPFVFKLKPPLGEIGCMLTVLFEYVYSAGNMLLVAITIDRLLMVSLDYSKYTKMQTSRHFKMIISGCFLYGFIGALIELSLWNFAKKHYANAASIDFQTACMYPPRRMKWVGFYISVCFFLVPILLVGILSAVFFKRLRKRIHKTRQIGSISTVTGSIDANNESVSVADTASSDAGTNIGSVVRKRYIKPAVTLAALVTSMLISMLPYCIYLFISGFSEGLNVGVTYIMWLIIQLNPMLDPLFYAATQKSLREFYRNKIRGMCR